MGMQHCTDFHRLVVAPVVVGSRIAFARRVVGRSMQQQWQRVEAAAVPIGVERREAVVG